MSSELTILGYYGIWIIAVILVQVLVASGQVGLFELATARENTPKLQGLAGRLDRAQKNSIVAMTLFAPAVLLLEVKGVSTSSTLLAAQVFLIARILYVLIYAAGTPWLRTVSWIVAFLSIAYLFLMAL